MRDPVLAAKEDRPQVDVLHALPGIEPSLQHGVVVGRRDAGVVEEHVDAPELVLGALVHPADVVLVRHVSGQGKIPGRALLKIGADYLRALFLEQRDRFGTDAAGRAGYDADLALQASSHQPSSVAM